MGASENIIVALEFGSSAILGIAGYRKPDGTLKILGIEQERTTESIKKGVIYNIDTTTAAIRSIVARLSQRLGKQIKRAYVGLQGQSLHTERNNFTRVFQTKVKITNEVMDNLMDNNLSTTYPNAEILDVVPQEYTVGHHTVANPVGIQGEQIEAKYLNIVARRTLVENLKQCMAKAGIEIADMFIAPLALAECIVSESDRRSGCALVDFGAETTTVSVYDNTTLRHLVVIPIGGENITKDLMDCRQMQADESETIKRKHGVAYVAQETEHPLDIPISSNRTLNENELQNIIGARVEEIVANVWAQLKPMTESLLAGIIITGGAAQMKDMTEAIKHYTGQERVKAAKNLITTADVAPGVVTPQGTNLDTLLSLLLTGEANCTDDLEPEEVSAETHAEISIDEVEDKLIEQPVSAEAPEEVPQDPEPAEQKPEEKKEKKAKNYGQKFKNFGSWLTKMVSEDEDDEDY